MLLNIIPTFLLLFPIIYADISHIFELIRVIGSNAGQWSVIVVVDNGDD